MNPEFLSIEAVIKLHDDQIEEFGGDPGIKELGLIESAVAQPSAGFGGEYFHEDQFAMAAAYLFHISKNHGFVDGNKRTGLAAALVFLEINGITLDEAYTEDLYAAASDVAEGRLTKVEAAELLRKLYWNPPGG